MADVGHGIWVLAGTNGAGKSSIGGAMIRTAGADYFNPDEAARAVLEANPRLTQAEANAQAWEIGKRLLERAIAAGNTFAFETTLGGETMTALLERAAGTGLAVRIWYCGLSSPELHLARVRARVRRGGHDIPEADIRRRYDQSRLNLIKLLPVLRELRVFDNSAEGERAPVLVLHLDRGRIAGPRNLAATPTWAKPVVAAALRLARRARR